MDKPTDQEIIRVTLDDQLREAAEAAIAWLTDSVDPDAESVLRDIAHHRNVRHDDLRLAVRVLRHLRAEKSGKQEVENG